MKKVLIIDDEHTVAAVVCDQVNTIGGYKASYVTNIHSANDLIKTVGFDIILTDLMMPGVTTHGIAENVKMISDTTSVILMTGYANDSAVDAIMNAGCKELLVKPFRINELKEALGRIE
jgi:DNA-binding NtrC family response regulator